MEPLVGQLLVPRHALGMVVLSYAISFFGSLLALLCARQMVRNNGSVDFTMLAFGAVALGGIGIWSMHFIGMTAYRLPVPIAYNVPLILISLVMAIVISGIALYLAGSKRFDTGGRIAGGLLVAVGPCATHYMGMFAMDLRATMILDWNIVVGSFAISGIASMSMLWLAFHLTEIKHQVAAAAQIGLSICAVHYVGMTAASMVCTSIATPSTFAITGGSSSGIGVFSISADVLVLILWALMSRIRETSEKMPA